MPNTTIQTPSKKSQPHSTAKIGKHTRPSSSSKSKYAHKARVNANKPKAVVKQGPVNSYTSVCCNVPATKKACVRVGKKEALLQGLGSWRCSGCKKACRVSVSKATAHTPLVLAVDVRATELPAVNPVVPRG